MDPSADERAVPFPFPYKKTWIYPDRLRTAVRKRLFGLPRHAWDRSASGQVNPTHGTHIVIAIARRRLLVLCAHNASMPAHSTQSLNLRWFWFVCTPPGCVKFWLCWHLSGPVSLDYWTANEVDGPVREQRTHSHSLSLSLSHTLSLSLVATTFPQLLVFDDSFSE